MKNNKYEKGFILAGLMNFSVLFFSKFFTNSIIAQYDIEVMSNFGLLMIVMWGVAYISISRDYHQVKWLIGLFALEKLAYGLHWIHWHSTHDASTIYNQDKLAGIFFTIYGLNDLLFFLFFSFVFVKLYRN